MTNLEEEYEIFQRLKEIDRYASFNDYGLDLFVYEKIYWALLMKLFPEYDSKDIFPYCLREDGSIVEAYVQGLRMNNFDDGITRLSIVGSATTDIVFRYYEKSPYWDTYERVAGYDEEEEKELDDAEDNFEIMEVFFPYPKEDGGCFFERGCVDIMEAQKKLPSVYFYDMSYYSCDDLLALKSYLLPYYFRYLKKGKKKGDEQYIMRISSALEVLKAPYDAVSISVLEPNLDASYYVYFDGSTDEFYGSGILKINKATILAGKIIDDCILALDEKHHFLPEKVKRGRDDGK